VSGHRQGLWRAALGLALEFETWRSLVRRQGIEEAQAAELMVGLVRGAARGSDAPNGEPDGAR